MLLNTAKCQGYSFYHFWVIKGKSTEGAGLRLPPTQIRVKLYWIEYFASLWWYTYIKTKIRSNGDKD